jgi:hypothetical protein
MLRTRSSRIGLVACGLVALSAGLASAAGETVTTTVKVPKTTAIKKKTPGQSKVLWAMDIKKPDGSRAANLSAADLTLPKAVFADAKGFKACDLAKLQSSDDKSCPAKSVVGSATADIYSSPIREEPYASTGVIYYTGSKGKTVSLAVFYTLTEIPTVHSVTPVTITRGASTSKIHMDQPKLPTAPGLPDATPLDISWTFDGKGAKGLLFRQAKPCKKGTTVPAKYTFYDGSSTSVTAKAC